MYYGTTVTRVPLPHEATDSQLMTEISRAKLAIAQAQEKGTPAGGWPAHLQKYQAEKERRRQAAEKSKYVGAAIAVVLLGGLLWRFSR